MTAPIAPERWTAVATSALAAASAVTAWAALRVVRHVALISAAVDKGVFPSHVVETSAVSSPVSEAADGVSMKAQFIPLGLRTASLVLITNEGASLWVHKVRVGLFAPHAVDGSHLDLPEPEPGAECPFALGGPPFLVRGGDYVACIWPAKPNSVDLGLLTILNVEVTYGHVEEDRCFP
jgi:hypothetical protein